jgi:hypothetical protein
MKKYGKTEEETQFEKVSQCREIVREIIDFGVDEMQKIKIIYLLSLEIENRNLLETISKATDNMLNGEVGDNYSEGKIKIIESS